MDCTDAREWLLRSDLAEGETSPAGVAAHLAGCAACRSYADRLRGLERAVRELPAPAGADAAREAFLERLRAGGAARRPIPLRTRRWVAAAAAAAILVAGAGTLVLTLGGSQPSEASVVLDQLVDWNLEVANAGSPSDRDRLYAARAGDLERRVREVRFAADEHELATTLLENSARLARDGDPLAGAEALTDVTSVVVRQMGRAASKGDVRKTKGLNAVYARLVQRGVNAKIDRIEDPVPPLPEHDRQLEKLLKRNAEMRDELATLLKTSPAATQDEIRRALNLPVPKRHRSK
jgi:hypothetical protein